MEWNGSLRWADKKRKVIRGPTPSCLSWSSGLLYMMLGTWPSHEQAFLPGGGPSLLAVGCSVYILTLALQGECLWNPAPASREAARGPQLGVRQAAPLSLDKMTPFLTFQKGDSKASFRRSNVGKRVYSFSSCVKIPRHSASWSSEQNGAGVASVPWRLEFSLLL